VSIYLVTGPPGTGKTWFALRTMLEALVRGKWVASNVEMHDHWPKVLARQQWLHVLLHGGLTRARRREILAAKAERYREACFVSSSLTELMALRLPPCGKCSACADGLTCRTEGRGVMVLDEAHEWLNARTWDTDDSGRELSKGEAIAMRLAIVRFFALHRKLGWDIYLVTQDEKRLDTQVRGNFEFHTVLKNLRKARVFFGLVPLWPRDLFVAITFWHGSKNDRQGTRMYGINKLANLYDTMASPSLRLGEEPEHTIIRLPYTREMRERRERGQRLIGERTQDDADSTEAEAASAAAPPRGRAAPARDSRPYLAALPAPNNGDELHAPPMEPPPWVV